MTAFKWSLTTWALFERFVDSFVNNFYEYFANFSHYPPDYVPTDPQTLDYQSYWITLLYAPTDVAPQFLYESNPFIHNYTYSQVC